MRTDVLQFPVDDDLDGISTFVLGIGFEVNRPFRGIQRPHTNRSFIGLARIDDPAERRGVPFHDYQYWTLNSCEGPHSPDQVPIRGWPSWATIGATAVIVKHARTTKKPRRPSRASEHHSALYGATRLLRSTLHVLPPIIRIGSKIAVLADELELFCSGPTSGRTCRSSTALYRRRDRRSSFRSAAY